jgi:hypothetical protein
MPKGFVMAQISRPFQIALVAVGLLAAVWLFALHGRSASTTESSGSAPASTPATTSGAAAQEKAAAAPTTVYKGAAPGVAGLTGAVAKAHGAVATSQQNAKELESKSAQASTTGGSAATSTAAAPTATKAAAPAAPAHAPTTHTSTTVVKVTTGAPAGQKMVESDLAKGDVVVLLFWTPAGSADQSVHREVRTLATSQGKVAVHEASAGQVTYFGSITRGVQVNGTPTVLVINKHGRTIVLTGLQDAYAVRQAIAEARAS